MYSKTSNALKDEYYTHEAPRSTKSAAKEKSDKKLKKQRLNIKKQQKLNKIRKQKIVATVALVSSMAFIVLFRYAAIAKEFSELTQTKSELALVNAKVLEKQMEAERNVDPKRIEQEAERLGLHQPSKEQIKYISLGNSDNGEVLKNENKGVFSAFINRIAVILEYLY